MTTETSSEKTPLTFKDFVVVMIWLGLPYSVIGVLWADAHNDHIEDLHGLDAVFSYLGEILVWPLLMFSNISLK